MKVTIIPIARGALAKVAKRFSLGDFEIRGEVGESPNHSIGDIFQNTEKNP